MDSFLHFESFNRPTIAERICSQIMALPKIDEIEARLNVGVRVRAKVLLARLLTIALGNLPY